jgi:hypothetical protein
MVNIWEIPLAVVKLVIIAAIGFYLYRKKYIEDKALNFLVFFVVSITVPFLIFSHLMENAKVVLTHSLFTFIFVSLIIFLVGYILGLIFSFKSNYAFKKEFISLVTFQNSGYLPMNIAFFLFPLYLREQFLVYIFLYLLGFNIIMWSVGSFFIFKKKGEIFQLKSILTPPTVSIFLALILIYTNISRFIPSFILSPVKMVGDTSFVLSMIVLGSWLAKVKLKEFYNRLFILSKVGFLKLIIIPFIFLMAVVKLQIFSLLGLFIVLETAMPSAVSLPMVVNLRRADSEFTSQGVFFTHILSIFTIPIWLTLFLKLSKFSF